MRRFDTPKKWEKYEREAVKVAQKWINSKTGEGWYAHIHEFAADVYNRGEGLVFLEFNERTQKSFMKKEFKEWMERILNNISRLPFY